MTKERILLLIMGVLAGMLAAFVCDAGEKTATQTWRTYYQKWETSYWVVDEDGGL